MGPVSGSRRSLPGLAGSGRSRAFGADRRLEDLSAPDATDRQGKGSLFQLLGAPGLALGTTIGALFNVGLLRLFYRRHVGPLTRPGRWRELGWLALANLAMTAALVLAWWAADLGLARLALPGLLHSLALALALTLVIGLGFAVFVGVLGASDFPGAASLARMPGGLWRRIRRRRT